MQNPSFKVQYLLKFDHDPLMTLMSRIEYNIPNLLSFQWSSLVNFKHSNLKKVSKWERKSFFQFFDARGTNLSVHMTQHESFFDGSVQIQNQYNSNL
jgi:hypothetical protein